MNCRIGILVCAWLVAGTSPAAVPADVEIAQVQRLFGFTPAVTRRVIQGSFERQPEFSRYGEAQKTCFLDALQPDVENELRESFKRLFADAETVAAWLRFGRTAGGDRFTGLLRAAVDARLDGKIAPNPLAAVADMSDAERADVLAFMESPAALVLKKDFPEMKIPVAAATRAAQRCDIDLSGGRS